MYYILSFYDKKYVKVNEFGNATHWDFWGSFTKKYINWMQCALGVLLIWHNYALITAFGSCWWPKRAENLAEIDIARKLLVVTHCKLFPPSSSVFFSLFLLGCRTFSHDDAQWGQISFLIAFEFLLRTFGLHEISPESTQYR